ncbi:MAG: hypothetical protein KAI53_01260 [Candidatus Aenigmarchaeota archaeon]|nr:hypothetical protein [Candidatus Aenigmarchaeota archaeon]
MKRRKGQFFVISAVIVVILLMSISSILSDDNAYSPAGQQKEIDEFLWNLDIMMVEINELISYSTADNLDENINAYFITKKDTFKKAGFAFSYIYDDVGNKTYITLNRGDIEIEKTYDILIP